MTDDDDAWQALYRVIPRGWVVGRPPFDERTRRWRLYGYDRRRAGESASPPLSTESESEEEAVREMTQLLRDMARAG